MNFEDDDAGDISLAGLPSSTSMPHLSSGPSRSAATSTPKLYGKGLWPVPDVDPRVSSDSSRQSLDSNYNAEGSTPRAAPGRSGETSGPSSSNPSRTNSSVSVSQQRTSLSKESVSSRPEGFTRRSTSNSTLSRSRSVNARLTLATPSHTGDTDMLSTSSPSGSAGLRTPSMRIGYARRPGDPRPPPLVSEVVRDRVGRWIKEIVVCNFDLERGPVVERRALGRRWGPGEKENVAFSSFPDTSLFTEGSILFSFKIRSIPPDPSSLSYPEPPSPLPDKTYFGPSSIRADERGTPTRRASLAPPSPLSEMSSSPLSSTSERLSTGRDKAEEYRRWDERGREWLFGYVWFEQRKDRGIARGYMQKSLVILSHLPFPGLFIAVLDRIAPIFFEHGYSALEAACHSIASWPDPLADANLELPFMSNVLNVKIPDQVETPQIEHVSSPSETMDSSIERPIPASLPHSSPLRAFSTFLPSLWSIWECLVLAEPVLVIAPDPRRCSEIVWWFRDLLRPIPPAGDFRPYLHIHDHDFSLLVNSNKPQPGLVIGVTNPFFRNAASHWPNVVSVPSDKPKRVVSNGTASPRLDPPDGFLSRRHRSVLKDRALLKRLEGLVAEGDFDNPAGNQALRTHFQQLTEKMLVPLNRYFQTLVPTLSPMPGTPLPGVTSLRPFSIPAFLAHVRSHGPNPLGFRTKGLSTKSRVENDFYAAFCMSPTFAGWLRSRIDSLGLAVAAQNRDSLDVSFVTPRKSLTSTTLKPKVGLGISSADQDHIEGRLSTSTSTGDTGYTSSDATRLSSDSSGSHRWRMSEEVSRGNAFSNGDTFGRRGSEGIVKAMANLGTRSGSR